MNTLESERIKELERQKALREKQKKCKHLSIRRFLTRWLCNDCDAEFQPVDLVLRRIIEKIWGYH